MPNYVAYETRFSGVVNEYGRIININNDNTVDIVIGNGVDYYGNPLIVTRVPIMGVYTPKIGDIVLISWQGSTPVIVGNNYSNPIENNYNIIITSPSNITNNVIINDHIQNGTISANKLQVGTITADSAVIADAAITTAKIADLAVTDAKIQNLDASKITSGNIATERLTANVISAINLSVEDAKINGAKIKEASIDDAHIISLNADKIISGNLQADVMKANVIEAINLSTSQAVISQAKIDDLDASKIVSGDIETDRMKANVIEAINLSTSQAVIEQAKIGNLDASKITSGDIEAERMKANVIEAINLSAINVKISQAKIEDLDASKIVSGDISTDRLKANVINAINLSASNVFIEGAKIKDASIDNAKISWLDASKIIAGDISADRMKANVIEAINLSTSQAVIDSARIGTIDASKITSGTIDTSKVTISTSATGQGARIDIVNDGIYLFDNNNNTIARFATNHGLVVHSPAGIKLDNNGSIKLGPSEDVVIDSYGLKAKAGSNTYTAFFTGEGIKIIDPLNNNKQIIINSGQVKLTTDGGLTFKAALTPEGLYGNVILDGTLPATKFDTIPPSIPTWREEGVSSIVEQTPETQIVSIIVKWNEVADNDLEGYRIYIAEGNSNDYFPIATLGKTNYYKIIGVKPNTTYKIIVTSFDKLGNECSTNLPPSQIYTTYPKIITTAKDIIAPAKPINLKVISGFKLFMLSWDQVIKNTDNSNCYDLSHYEIQRSSSLDWNIWITIGQIKGTSYIDKDVEYFIEYKYRIRAVDTSGNVSEWSDVIYAGMPLQIGAGDIIAHSITTEHIATSGLSADVITSGKIKGDLIEANTITADKFESRLYGDLVQALRYVENKLKEKVFEWIGTTENYQQGVFNGTYSVNNILMLDTVYHWDDALKNISYLSPFQVYNSENNLVWDGNFNWDKPVVTYGTWESPEFDLNALVTVLCLYQFNASLPEGSEVKVYLKYSEDGISWTDYEEFTSKIITARYIKFKIELSTINNKENIKINNFVLKCFVDTPEVVRIDFEEHKNDFNNPHRVYHNQTMPLEVDETDTNTIRDKHISNLQAKQWEEHRLNTSLTAHGNTTNDTINVGGVNSSGNIVVNGQLGINTTPSGNYRLKIKEASSADGYGLQIENADASKSMQLWVGIGGAVIDAQGTTNLHLRTAGVDRLYIANGGNIGIGTINPSSKLEISGGSIRLPSSGFEGAGQIQCAGTVKFGNGTAAQEVYVKQISVTDSWTDADNNKVTNGIYTKGGIKTGGQIISTVTTGTAPFSINSTTVVTNLNSDLLDGYHANTGTTANTIPVRDSSGNLPGNITGNAATATKLQTAKNISLSGDITGSASFDGSSDITINGVLTNSGVIAGTYTKVTVDAKGRVTSGTTLSVTDIPSHKSTHASGGSDALTPSDIGAVSKSGDTMTGTLNVPGLNVTINNSNAVIFGQQNGDTGNFRFLNLYSDGYHYIQVGKSSSDTAAKLRFSRFNSTSNLAEVEFLADSFKVNGNTVWHAGNDGVNSGLDADLLDGMQPSTSATANTIVQRDISGNITANTFNGSLNGNATTATKLQTARNIALTGDVSGSVSFDGSANVSISTTLANTGVTAGTYRQVTVDAKGRVTAGSNPTTLADYGITDAVQNAGNTPSIQAGLDSNKPTAGISGRLYIATDTKIIYRDDGTAWQTIVSTSGTASRLEASDANIINTTGTGNIVNFQVNGVTKASVDNTGKFTGTIDWANINSKPSSYTPSAHKSTHASGGSDALTPADIGAVSKSGDTMTGTLSVPALLSSDRIFQIGTTSNLLGFMPIITPNVVGFNPPYKAEIYNSSTSLWDDVTSSYTWAYLTDLKATEVAISVNTTDTKNIRLYFDLKASYKFVTAIIFQARWIHDMSYVKVESSSTSDFSSDVSTRLEWSGSFNHWDTISFWHLSSDTGVHRYVRITLTLSVINTAQGQIRLRQIMFLSRSDYSSMMEGYLPIGWDYTRLITFYNSIQPNTNASYDIGSSSLNWRNAYFSGNIYVGGSNLLDDIMCQVWMGIM